MKFRIDTEVLKKAIEVASHATSFSQLTPILENLMIEAYTDRVTIIGNNMEMAIEYLIEDRVTVEKTGKSTISSKFLTSYIALVMDKEVEIESDNHGNFWFRTKSGETKFKGANPDKFPVIPTVPMGDPLRVEGRDMKQAIEKTIFSTADGSIRPMLAGIFLRAVEGALIFATTDSFRLSELRIQTLTGGRQISIIIPTKTALELGRIVTDDTSHIDLYIHENQILILAGSARLSSRLLAGKFPDYEAFFPSEYRTKTVILRNEFINGLKQTNLVARENNYNTRIRSLSAGEVQITTGDTEVGKSQISIAASVEGDPEIVGLNAHYLLQALGVIKEDYVSFEYKTALSPIVLKGVPAENGKYSYRHLIMPLKI